MNERLVGGKRMVRKGRGYLGPEFGVFKSAAPEPAPKTRPGDRAMPLHDVQTARACLAKRSIDACSSALTLVRTLPSS